MARIFYRRAGGTIYGVHPGAPYPPVPAGIDFIDVPETPDQIPWPVNARGQSGEAYARVAGGSLVAFVPQLPPELPVTRALRALAQATGQSAAIEAILGPAP